MGHDDLDGRDSKVSAAHKTLQPTRISQDDHVKQYTDPWLPAYYSMFDDVKPGKPVLYDNCVEGILGLRAWSVPVTGIQKMLDGGINSFEQVSMGILDITEYPLGDGTSELVISIS